AGGLRLGDPRPRLSQLHGAVAGTFVAPGRGGAGGGVTEATLAVGAPGSLVGKSSPDPGARLRSFRRMPASRGESLASALAVSYTTVAWSTASGVAALAVALRSRSLALAGLGVTVLIDVVSSVVLIWRFRHERGAEVVDDRPERVAHGVASV